MVLPVPGVLFVKEKSRVSNRQEIMLLVLANVGPAMAQSSGAGPDSKQKEKNLVAGEVEAKRLLLLMDRDQSGKVSKQEFMSFMEEEFKRLDINKDGELDVQELTQSRLTPHVGTHR